MSFEGLELSLVPFYLCAAVMTEDSLKRVESAVRVRPTFIRRFVASPVRENLFISVRSYDGSLSSRLLLETVIGKSELKRLTVLTDNQMTRRKNLIGSQDILSSPESSRARKRSSKQSSILEEAGAAAAKAEEELKFATGIGIVFVEMDLIVATVAAINVQYPELNARHYHSSVAGLLGDKGAAAEELLTAIRSGGTRCVVSSNALLLGLDISHVRVVVMLLKLHDEADLLQGFGRAGRDGKKAMCELWLKDRKNVEETDTKMSAFFIGLKTSVCVNVFFRNYFRIEGSDAESKAVSCGSCDLCSTDRFLRRTKNALKVKI